MEFTFIIRQPDGPLGVFVESVWYARGTIDYTRERIAPTGSSVAVVVLGAPIVATARNGVGEPFVATTGYLIGPHDGPVINEPTAETFAVGVVTTPVGCRPVFGIDPASIRGLVIDLATSWLPTAALRERLLAEDEPEAMLDLVEAQLNERLDRTVNGVSRCTEAVAALETEPGMEIRSLAAELGVSHGFLDREFVRVVGLTPRALARITRLRRLLDGLDVYAEINWTRVAIDGGWFDQSHFIRDFKRHTGVTPSAYAQSQREIFAPQDAAAGFVPER